MRDPDGEAPCLMIRKFRPDLAERVNVYARNRSVARGVESFVCKRRNVAAVVVLGPFFRTIVPHAFLIRKPSFAQIIAKQCFCDASGAPR